MKYEIKNTETGDVIPVHTYFESSNQFQASSEFGSVTFNKSGGVWAHPSFTLSEIKEKASSFRGKLLFSRLAKMRLLSLGLGLWVGEGFVDFWNVFI